MNKQKGFTLIELLVVIAIIGLLSTLAVVALNNAREKSRDAKRISDVKQIQTALELFYNDQGGYPTQSGNLGQGAFLCLDDTGFKATCGTGTVYMKSVPTNPTPNDGGNQYYAYGVQSATLANNGEYSLSYYLKADTGGVSKGHVTACSSGISGCSVQTP
jgi:type II secretion system protein G